MSQLHQELGFRVLAEIGELPFAVAFLSRKRALVGQPAQGSSSFLVRQVRPGKGELFGARAVAALARCYRLPCIDRQACRYVEGHPPRSELARVGLLPRSAPWLRRRGIVLCRCLHFFGQPNPEILGDFPNVALVPFLGFLGERLTTSVALYNLLRQVLQVLACR